MRPISRGPIWNRLSVRVRRRGRSGGELGGLWPAPASFYVQAKERISLSDEGWSVSARPPGHLFVAWEMAVRYEAACLEAAFHYTQICDGPDDAEFSVRMARIVALEDEARRLSRIEQAVRPMLPDDALSIRAFAMSPRPHPLPPQESRLLALADRHLSDIQSELIAALRTKQQGEEFHPRIFDQLVAADQQIPGPGMHSAVWTSGQGYQYPFDEEYEAILRPLRYIPTHLRAACADSMFIRPAVQFAGAHLEGCVKRLAPAKTTARARLQPLGALLQTAPVKDALGADLVADMTSFTRLAVNPAKHEYTGNSGQGPVFCYDDAVYAYFLARHFGHIALQASGDLESLTDAVADSTRHDRYFWGAAHSVGVEESSAHA